MPGRFSQNFTRTNLQEYFDLPEAEPLKPRYNVASSTAIAAVRVEGHGRRHLALLRWGLIPEWANDPKIGYKMINARSETVAEKPVFRRAFRARRCLVPASGYYEWKKEGKERLPFHITLRDGRPLAFAGIWERWENPEGPVESCAILTTEPCPVIRPLHHRMPAILQPADFSLWLDPTVSDVDLLQPLLIPYVGDDLLLSAPSSTRWATRGRSAWLRATMEFNRRQEDRTITGEGELRCSRNFRPCYYFSGR
jgi:putative SOS response-associated peptidase YedK